MTEHREISLSKVIPYIGQIVTRGTFQDTPKYKPVWDCQVSDISAQPVMIYIYAIRRGLVKDLDQRGMYTDNYPNSKVHGADMGPIWGRQDPGGPHVGSMNFAIWVATRAVFHCIWLSS